MAVMPAPMPQEHISSLRPPLAMSRHKNYVIEQSKIVIDRDGGTWVDPKATCTPAGARIPRSYLIISIGEEDALSLSGLIRNEHTFMPVNLSAEEMTRKKYLPVTEVFVEDPDEPQRWDDVIK